MTTGARFRLFWARPGISPQPSHVRTMFVNLGEAPRSLSGPPCPHWTDKRPKRPVTEKQTSYAKCQPLGPAPRRGSLSITWAMNLSTLILLVSWRARRPQRNSCSGGLLLGIFLYSRYLSGEENKPLPPVRQTRCCASGSQVAPSPPRCDAAAQLLP